jgi:transcriptional regulator with XRE-family HTH domain
MLTLSTPASVSLVITPDDKQFFKDFGSRLAQQRKEQGASQQAIADALGIAQQTYAHYEVGRLRMPMSLLPKLVDLFGVSTDELLGRKSGAGKRGPTPVLQKQIERLHRLPKAQQKVVMQMLDGVLSQAGRS